IAVWLGPGHVQDFSKGIPGCMVIDSDDDFVKKTLVDEFSSKLIRFYYGNDLIGNEIGAATKNVVGIAAGMLDAMNMSALKGALMTRGAYEVSKLIRALGGNPISSYGLCHLGDYAATVFSTHSQNRRFGEAFILGEKYEKLAEGYYTVKPVVNLANELDVQMPICQAIFDVLYNDMRISDAIDALFARDIKSEMHS
ncbi:MAG: glycerol-3-phosphate dehydrogenase, partial [Clostridiales bacterium]|nr:glycerol-3-phosphate dehydrogenase [Clostridiales bacterium]